METWIENGAKLPMHPFRKLILEIMHMNLDVEYGADPAKDQKQNRVNLLIAIVTHSSCYPLDSWDVHCS